MVRTFRFEPVVQTAAVWAASTVSINVYNGLVSQGIGDYLVWALVLPIAAIVYGFLDLLLIRLPLRIRFLRRLLSRTSSIEGYWFEGVHSKDYPFSVVCIEYVPARNAYAYHGLNYKPDGTRNASFRSIHSSVSDDGSGITFHFESTVHTWSPEMQRHAGTDAARGYCVIRFFTEGSRRYVRGEGEFFERNPEPNWKTFELYKIPPRKVKQALGTRHAVNDLDYELLLASGVRAREEERKKVRSLLGEVPAFGQLESSTPPVKELVNTNAGIAGEEASSTTEPS